jgi:hypothetical protein
MWRRTDKPPDRAGAAIVLALVILGMLSFVIVRRQQLTDVVVESVPAPVVIVPAGRLVTARGDLVSFAGFDSCTGTVLSGAAKDNSDCLALLPDQSAVQVTVMWPTGQAIERWIIVRDTGAGARSGWTNTSLLRPDGSKVIFEHAP